MAIEREYNVPLRREFIKAPKYKRTKSAAHALRRFLQKHMKSEDVLIGKRLNDKLWENGIRNPPHHLKVSVVKEDDGKVYAELSGFKYEKPVSEEESKKAKAELKKEAKKGEVEIKEELKELEKKTEKIKEEKAKKGEQKEKQIEKMEKKEELEEKKIRPGEKIPERQDKKRKENIHG